jgi:hypothetical protein
MSPDTTKRHIVVVTGFARDEISFVVETRTKMMALLSHLRFCESLQMLDISLDRRIA